MANYNGSKFYCAGTETKFDIWGNQYEKANFRMTRAYKQYLDEKRAEAEAWELKKLKASLEYQYKTYGEVDKYDYQRYLTMCGIKVTKIK